MLAILIVAGSIAFQRRDDRLAATFQFAVNEPELALKQIAQVAEGKDSLSGSGSGSGIGVAIYRRKMPNLGPTQWTITADGVVRGSAPERGQLVLLTPDFRNGKVAWNCKLEPEPEFIRNTCSHIRQANR
jgi:hypothetical protein